MIGIPYHFLFPAILVFCAIGAFSLANSTFDVFLLSLFGVVGYVLRKLDCEPAPLLLGFILGPMMEENLRRALMINGGDATVFFTRPISCVLLIAAVALLVMVLLPSIRARRDMAFQED
jgi:TctA family transporter